MTRARALSSGLTVGASALLLCVLAGGVACNRVTSPTPSAAVAVAPPSTAAPTPSTTLSGTVWVHGPNGTTAGGIARLSGWIQLEHSGWTTGWVSVDASGRYTVNAPLGALVRIYAGPYQPCEVLQEKLLGPTIRDVHVVNDPEQLGARVPVELLHSTPILSGVVIEAGSAGRRPVSDVELELDGLDGLGVVTARTRTDSDGRYVFCGLAGETSTYLFAIKGDYRGFEGTVQLNGTSDTTFDIEFGPIGSRN